MDLTLDATLAHLTSPASRRMPFRLPFRRWNAVVHGLSLRQIGEVCDRHEAVRDGVWHLFGLSNCTEYQRTDADARALLDLVMTSLGTRSPVALFRITRLSTDEFVDLVETMVRLTVPHMPEPLFEPKGKSTPPKEPEGPWDDPAVVLRKLAMRLDPPEGLLDWTPGRLLFLASTLGEHDAASARLKVANDAYAARIARAKDEGFRQAIAELQRG